MRIRKGSEVLLWQFGALNHVAFLSRVSLAIVLIGIVALGGGCAKAKPVHYYQIMYPSSTIAGANSLDVSIMVRNLIASHLYREDRIVFGNNAEEMGIYQNERWAEAPTDMLQNALVRGLRASGRFRSVTHLRSDSEGDFILSGHLFEFKEMDVNGSQARLTFDVEMRDAKTNKLVWTYAYNHDEPANGKAVAAVASAMSKNVEDSVKKVQAGLEEYFRDHPPK
jgi:ABC-type uncharacterized transport system auxiliary subunit